MSVILELASTKDCDFCWVCYSVARQKPGDYKEKVKCRKKNQSPNADVPQTSTILSSALVPGTFTFTEKDDVIRLQAVDWPRGSETCSVESNVGFGGDPAHTEFVVDHQESQRW